MFTSHLTRQTPCLCEKGLKCLKVHIYALIVTTLIALTLVSPYFFLLTDHVSAMITGSTLSLHSYGSSIVF